MFHDDNKNGCGERSQEGGQERVVASLNLLQDYTGENVKSVEKLMGGRDHAHVAWSRDSPCSPIVNL